ncbi:MAG: hypothetical protein M1825_006278 [Sarcosagium campestre]|nr:MAG: hypothetical protein M1825_006278 [Sarcosagium campestre]
MRAAGIKERMVVAGYLANHTNALVAMLSATSIGAVWSGISPDTGVQAVLERLEQIEPTLLFADNAVTYNGKQHDVQQKLAEITKSLRHLRAVVVFDTVKGIDTDVQSLKVPQGRAWTYQAFLDLSSSTSSGSEFAQLQPDHPVYVLYSSGTTGKPKCIVHGAIGTLIQHKKEHDLHCDIHSGDRLFYFTTCTWMMWHWLVSGLAVGATIILYDGSPFRTTPDPAARSSSSSSSNPGELAMPKLINDLAITHFGTSAKYLSVLEQKGTMPRPTYPMASLRAIYSTGSPLAPSTFRYVYRAFGPEINLGSITGGTDIISLFGAPCPLVPVHAGEVQCRGLGMAVEAWDADGKDVSSTGETGDLVCARAFPCQPVGFWGVDGTARYESSYFTRFPGVWHHGDFVRINPRTGGLVMLGRSDGILKPAGVRFGSAEIYNCLLRAFPTEVTDALCVGRRRAQDSDETVVLFLKMADGHTFSDELSKSIKAEIRRSLSARHVPGIVDECFDIPVTTNGKK